MAGLTTVAAVVVLLLLTRGVHDVAQATVAGLVTGAYFALGATGLSIVYGTLRLPNFAHGDLLTFGVSMAFWMSSAGLPFLAAAAVGLVFTAVLTVAIEFVLWRPMRARRASLFQLILITIGTFLPHPQWNSVHLGWPAADTARGCNSVGYVSRAVHR